MIITFKDSDTTDIKELAKEAISNRLYVAGWSLRYVYSRILNNIPVRNTKLVIAYHNDIPIASGIYIDEFTRYQSMFFTRKAFRRNKIGTLIKEKLDLMSKDVDFPVYNTYGTTKESIKFLVKVNMPESY